MRIKTITAESMEKALHIIRTQLGPEALILSTRKVTGPNGKPTLEITAAVQEPEPSTHPTREAPHNFVSEQSELTKLAARRSSERSESEGGQTSTNPLHHHNLPTTLLSKITAALPGLASAGFAGTDALEMLLAKLITFHTPTEIIPAGKIHIFIGPHGAGKTTLIAKLAIQSKKQGRSIGLLSLDDKKIGGFEPLAIAAEIMNETAHLLTNQHDLSTAAQSLGPRQLLLIDTPGLNPYQPQHLQHLAQHISNLGLPASKIATHLVVPANLNETDMLSLPISCHRFNLTSIVFTKLDATSRYGALTGTAAGGNLPIGLATHTPDMASAPIPLSAKWLAEALTHLPRQPWELTP